MQVSTDCKTSRVSEEEFKRLLREENRHDRRQWMAWVSVVWPDKAKAVDILLEDFGHRRKECPPISEWAFAQQMAMFRTSIKRATKCWQVVRAFAKLVAYVDCPEPGHNHRLDFVLERRRRMAW